MDKDKALLCAIRLAGAVCLAVFIASKSKTLTDLACAGSLAHGDLYREAKIRLFKEPFPEPAGEPVVARSPDESPDYRVILVGDSFLFSRFGHEALPWQVSKRLDEPVLTVLWRGPGPDCSFKRAGSKVDRSRRRIVVMESVERELVDRLDDVLDCGEGRRVSLEDLPLGKRLRAVEKSLTSSEDDHRFLLTNNVLTAALFERWNTWMFSRFGRIGSETPVYSLDPPFLFFREEVDRKARTSFYYEHSDAMLERYARKLAQLRDALREHGNAELIFMPVPNKYTLYHRFANKDLYDRFLPRLYDALAKEGVRTVRLYDRFSSSPDLLYFGSDTHWNAKGAAIAGDELMKELRR